MCTTFFTLVFRRHHRVYSQPRNDRIYFCAREDCHDRCKFEDDSQLASRKYAHIVQKLGFDVKFPIRLEGLAYSHGQFSSYEPEVRISLVLSMLR